jgi:hypothetical protein
MITKEQIKLAMHLHKEKGGHNTRPAGHCLKALGECVELCLAGGASHAEITEVIQAELIKSLATYLGEPSPKCSLIAMAHEAADVLICLAFITEYNGLNTEHAVDVKMDQWASLEHYADVDGVVRRKGRTHT